MENPNGYFENSAENFEIELRHFVNDRQLYHGLNDDAAAYILAELADDMTDDSEPEVTSDRPMTVSDWSAGDIRWPSPAETNAAAVAALLRK